MIIELNYLNVFQRHLLTLSGKTNPGAGGVFISLPKIYDKGLIPYSDKLNATIFIYFLSLSSSSISIKRFRADVFQFAPN